MYVREKQDEEDHAINTQEGYRPWSVLFLFIIVRIMKIILFSKEAGHMDSFHSTLHFLRVFFSRILKHFLKKQEFCW